MSLDLRATLETMQLPGPRDRVVLEPVLIAIVAGFQFALQERFVAALSVARLLLDRIKSNGCDHRRKRQFLPARGAGDAVMRVDRQR